RTLGDTRCRLHEASLIPFNPGSVHAGRPFRHNYLLGGLAVSRVLIIEDERKVLRSLERGLQAEGYEIASAANGEAGLELANTGKFDCIVLDLMLPKMDGLQVLSTLRQAGNTTPVLILTARDTVEDRVVGLDAGADDYLVKPFAFAEL